MKKLVFLVIFGSMTFAHAQQSPPIPPLGLDAVWQLDRLPTLRQGIWFHSVSSQDVTGGNDDGFTAAFSNQYVEDGRYVFLDARGPSCVQLFRTVRINQFTHELGFDGDLTIETRQGGNLNKYVLPFRDLYSGRRAPFLAPLVREEQAGHGSAWSFVPICSEDGIKISTNKGGPLLFYDIFYYTYSLGSAVKSFAPEMDVTPAVNRWKALGQPLDTRSAQFDTRDLDLPARTTVSVWASSGPGTVTAINLRLRHVSQEALRHVRIKAYWDGEREPSVNSPLGPFFGTGYWPTPTDPDTKLRYGFCPTTLQKGAVVLGRTATHSLPVGSDAEGFYNFFPMPFLKSARIDLVNESDTVISGVEVTVKDVAGQPPPSSAYFHAQWREEDPTLPHHDYTVLETRGHGHYVGSVLVMSSINYDSAKSDQVQRSYLEGDARFYIDDNRTFANASTGTEEYFLWGWYDLVNMDRVFSFPVNGYPTHDIDSQDNSVMYRFHLSDLVPYYRSFRFALEHGPEGEIPSHYSSTGFYYQVDTPALLMTDQLAIDDPRSERSHSYFSGNVVWHGCRDLPFEGDRQIVFTNAYEADLKKGTRESLQETLHACGQRVVGGPIEFTASILPNNQGMKLRRMLDYASPDIVGQAARKRSTPLIAPGETARLFVDGELVGEWYTPPRHARLAWLEDDFEIPARFTVGKTQVKIRLQIAPETSWSAFQYRAYTYLNTP